MVRRRLRRISERRRFCLASSSAGRLAVLRGPGSASAPVLGKDALRLRTRNRYWVARRHRGVGRIAALLWEDLKKCPSVARTRGVWEGLRT